MAVGDTDVLMRMEKRTDGISDRVITIKKLFCEVAKGIKFEDSCEQLRQQMPLEQVGLKEDF